MLFTLFTVTQAHAPSCTQWCESQNAGVGNIIGTAPFCDANCANDCSGACTVGGVGEFSDYGSGCWSGNKICCCTGHPKLGVAIPDGTTEQDPKLGVAIPYASTQKNQEDQDPKLGVAIPYASTEQDPKLGGAPIVCGGCFKYGGTSPYQCQKDCGEYCWSKDNQRHFQCYGRSCADLNCMPLHASEKLGVAIPYGATEQDPKLGVKIPYDERAATNENLGVAIPYASTEQDQDLGSGAPIVCGGCFKYGGTSPYQCQKDCGEYCWGKDNQRHFQCYGRSCADLNCMPLHASEKLGVAIPYGAQQDPKLGVVKIPYASTEQDPKLGMALTAMYTAARSQTFTDKSAAKAFFGSSFARICGDQMCALSGLASNMPGFVCPQHRATSILTHQKVTCQYNGSWQKETAAPSDCDYSNKWQCTAPSNNCWNTPSYNCQQWCTCYGNRLSHALTSRLGAGLLEAAAPVSKKDANTNDAKKDSTQVLGSSMGGGCDPSLPALYRQEQRTTGYQITCFKSKGTFCAYPNEGMNFVCTGYDGIWQLQGAAPVPTPVWPAPTPAPENECPGWWFIWSGWTSCYRNGRICRYSEYRVNFVCERGVWQQQGNAPAPTQPPVQNPASCPDHEHNLRRGNYCSSPHQKCHYPNGVTWRCTPRGVWTDRTRSSPKLSMCAFPYGCGR